MIRGCKITKCGDEWRVYVPPAGAHSFDVDGWSYVGPYGDSFWPSHRDACDWLAMVQGTEDDRRRNTTFTLDPPSVNYQEVPR